MTADTVGLNWKRPPEWDRLKREGEKRLPSRDASTGIMVEMAWAEFKSDHRIESVINRFLDATEGLSVDGEGEKISRDRFSSSGRTTVRVDKSVKEEMKAYARKHNTDPYIVLRSVISNYLDGGLLGWAADQLEKLESRIDFSDLRKSAPERRRDEIIRELESQRSDGDLSAFTLEEFNQAIERGPEVPKAADDNALETYLPMVLDKLNMSWHPGDNRLFVEADTVEKTSDTRNKPKALMSDSDIELAIAIDAAETILKADRPTKYTKDDAVSIPGVAYNNVRSHMRKAAEREAYTFDESETILKVNLQKISDRDVADVLNDDGRTWVERAADMVDVDPDSVPDDALEKILMNKIARAQHPGRFGEDDPVPDDVLDEVTDDDLDTLRKELGLVDSVVGEITTADEELDTILGAQAATDGGTTGSNNNE